MSKLLPPPASHTERQRYARLLADIKTKIQSAQARALSAVNAQLIHLYWECGRLLDERQTAQGWGAAVIPQLAKDIRNELLEIKGFSPRNMDRMLAFARAYPQPADFSPQAVAKLGGPAISPQAVAKLAVAEKTAQPTLRFVDSLLWQVPWGHHALLLEKVKPLQARRWYMAKTLNEGWSRNLLAVMVDSAAHKRQGKLANNFEQRLPKPQSDLVQQALKDPYIFDFLTLQEPFHERELETGLVRHLEKFLLELGQGFAFVGRQYCVAVGDAEFYIDLLFYHLKLRSYIVIELKRGEFEPGQAGKINFYCNVVDDRLRHATDAPTIGLLLCQSKDNVLAEYALRGINKPIGIASYKLTRALPKKLKSALPSIETIESELLAITAKKLAKPAAKPTAKPAVKAAHKRATKPVVKAPVKALTKQVSKAVAKKARR